MAILEGFAPINLVETKGESVMTVTPSSIKFNKATAVELGYPAYARLLVNAKENKVALQGWPKKDDCSFEFSSPEGQQTYGAIFIPNLFFPAPSISGNIFYTYHMQADQKNKWVWSKNHAKNSSAWSFQSKRRIVHIELPA